MNYIQAHSEIENLHYKHGLSKQECDQQLFMGWIEALKQCHIGLLFLITLFIRQIVLW